MSFTAFFGAVFLTYCLQEPFAHQASNFYAQAGYRSQDEIALFAINMAVSNWGILFWSHYTLVGVSMSLAAHRFNLPLILRSAYYPILGAYTWGWMGDFLDGFVNFIMIASSASLLDLAARQLVAGFVHMGWVDAHSSAEELNSFAAATVWLIVFVSSASIISGLRAGIRFMSLAAMSMAILLLVLVLFLDDTKYVLNLCVQETGYFLQTSVLQLNFWTDAFGQLKAGSGGAVDGKAAEDWWVDAVRFVLVLVRLPLVLLQWPTAT
jgi:choline-glycine betaine transporter